MAGRPEYNFGPDRAQDVILLPSNTTALYGPPSPPLVLDIATPANQMKTAQASDWQRKELPSEKGTLSIGRRFTLAEMEQVRRGCIPEQMEDKWFVYWENNTLYFHRSWTGICIYIARFHEEQDGYVMRDADVNRDPEQYQTTSDEEDVRLLSDLIDVVLLRRP